MNPSRFGWALVLAGLLPLAAGYLTAAPAPLPRRERPNDPPPWPVGLWVEAGRDVSMHFGAGGGYHERHLGRDYAGSWRYLDPHGRRDEVFVSCHAVDGPSPGDCHVARFWREGRGGIGCTYATPGRVRP